MTNSRFYMQGERDGFKFYAPSPNVYNGMHRIVRRLTGTELAEYMAGYKAGKSRVDGRRLASLGYGA